MKLSRQNAGTVSIVTGIIAVVSPLLVPFFVVGTISGVVALPIALVTGITAVRDKQKTLGWIGLSLVTLAIIIWIFIIIVGIQVINNPNN